MNQNEKINLKKIVSDIKINVAVIRAEGLKDPFKIELQYLERYSEQYDNYPFLIKKIIKNEDLTILNKMLESIDNIDKGSDKFEEEKKLGKILEKKYVEKQ
jgi:hypothetical protein